MVLGSNLGREKIFLSPLEQGNVVHTVTVLLAGWSWFQILLGTKDSSLVWGRVAWFI